MLREGLIGSVSREKQSPFLNVYRDQIVWGRSPVRIDLAGGWTDTPPYCMYAGGNVVNVAIELNGQPPLQVYVKPSKEYKIILRSIDLGAMEVVSTWDELHDYKRSVLLSLYRKQRWHLPALSRNFQQSITLRWKIS